MRRFLRVCSAAAAGKREGMKRPGPWHSGKIAILPVLKSLFLATRFRRIEKRLNALSNRIGFPQLGGSVQLFETVPGLSYMAMGGLGAK